MTESIFEPAAFNKELSVCSPPIEVRCYRMEDRTGHSIFIQDSNGGVVEILRSVEGDSTQEFPPSGPIQEMVLEEASIGKPPVLMGLGSAGKSTWSCSIEADATIAAVAFDFACKTRSADWFGATYRIADFVEAKVNSENSIRLGLPDDDRVISFRCFGEGELALDREIRTIKLTAAIPAADLSPSLRVQRRWRYVVGLASNLEFASDH